MITASRARTGARRAFGGVDLPAALALVGTVAKYVSLTFAVPAAVALGYGEPVWPFLAAGGIGVAAGVALERLAPAGERVGMREGFLVVSLAWLVVAALGALPYLFSGEEQLDRPLDAYFEAMSGFTTTGATVLTDIEAVSHSLALWRQLTQWLGGMGIIVLALAVLPRLRVGGRQLLESELPGPELDHLSTRIRDTARSLWVLYIALTVLQIGILAAIGWTGIDETMSVFEAVAHALTTMPTGGFSTEARSVEAFGAATQWTIVVFMVLAGANFALMYRAFFRRQVGALVRDEELRLYLALLALASAVLLVELLHKEFFAGEEAVRHAVFQVVSTMTTSGFASTDSNQWTLLGIVVIVALMFVGGSAGSTTGSVKVVRHLLTGRILRRELDQTVHPEVVSRVRLNGRPIDDRTLRAVGVFIILYVGVFAVGALLLVVDGARVGLEDFRLLDAVSVSAAMIGNVGPAFGFAGPMGSYEPFSDFSTVVMVALMWLGRLEIIPVIVLFTRNYWRV